MVVTPPITADYIISRLGKIESSDKILDPCVGPGIFIKALIRKGINANQIHSFDINSEYKSDLERDGITFKEQDTLLSFTEESYSQYDFIVGNPPYLNKSSKYIRTSTNKIALRKLYGKINAHETYSMFIVNAIWRLKEGGKLGFITSDSFLTLRTHEKLRKFILNNCKIEELLLAPKNLFDNQNVSTSPVIMIFEKCSGPENQSRREENLMKIVPRIKSENDYNNLRTFRNIPQKNYNLLPFNLFFTDVEDEIIRLFEGSMRLEEVLKGYIGMHTHNNLKYIAAIEKTELAEIFNKRNLKIKDIEKQYKVISEEELESNKWRPYLKRGGADQYWRPIMEGLDWDKDSIPIYDIPKNVPFENEGVVISGVSSRLAVRYMPKGCYWDSNKAIGFLLKDQSISINYIIGLLNSSLYNYFAKGIINNTNSIQITGIHALPFIRPNTKVLKEVEDLVEIIIDMKRVDLKSDYISEQKKIDNIIYNFYSDNFNLPKSLKRKLDNRFSIY